jgi:hypothetical protein
MPRGSLCPGINGKVTWQLFIRARIVDHKCLQKIKGRGWGWQHFIPSFWFGLHQDLIHTVLKEWEHLQGKYVILLQ